MSFTLPDPYVVTPEGEGVNGPAVQRNFEAIVSGVATDRDVDALDVRVDALEAFVTREIGGFVDPASGIVNQYGGMAGFNHLGAGITEVTIPTAGPTGGLIAVANQTDLNGDVQSQAQTSTRMRIVTYNAAGVLTDRRFYVIIKAY